MSNFATLSTAIQKLDEKITAANTALNTLRTKREELVLERTAVEKVEQFADKIKAGLPVNTEVTYTFGRDKTKTTFTGKVLGFKAAAEKVPAQYRITTGEGFDAVIHTVPYTAITAVNEPQPPVVDVAQTAAEGEVS